MMYVLCDGYTASNPREKDIRQVLGLPVLKQFVYYPSRHGSKPISIKNFFVSESYESFYTVTITLDNGRTLNIHHKYLKQMQSPTFLKDMEAEDRAV